MAYLIGDTSKSNLGEKIFADSIVKNLPDYASLKMNLDLLGVLDIDSLIIHPELGNFIIEIKNHSIKNLSSMNGSSFTLAPNPETPRDRIIDPVSQARNQLFSLQQYFWARNERAPYLFVGVAFTSISREEFREKFGNEELSRNIFFREDLVSLESIESVLKNLVDQPFQGRKVSKRIATDSNAQDILKKVCKGEFRSPLKRSFENASALFQDPKKMEHRDIEKVTNSKLYKITGNAGSGKTYRLLKWANFQANMGNSVLVLTFNNALASELRRINANTDEAGSPKGNLIVFSFSEFLKHTEQRFGIPPLVNVEEDISDVMERRYLNAVEHDWEQLEKFDYIAIDEGQDVQDYVWNLIKIISHEKTKWSIVWAKNQNLYAPDGSLNSLAIYKFMQAIDSRETFTAEMPKSFRSKTFTWILGQILGNHAGPVGNLTKYSDFEGHVEKFLATNPLQLEKNLFNKDVIDAEFLIAPQDNQLQRIESEINLMLNRVLQLGNDAAEMILFASRKDWRYKVVIDYLTAKEFPFVDHVKSFPDNPNVSVKPSEIRLTTIHRARGIDSTNSIVFGLENIEYADSTGEQKHLNRIGRNLMYIGLTRAKYRTVIFGPEENLNWSNFSPNSYSSLYEQMLIIHKILEPKIEAAVWN